MIRINSMTSYKLNYQKILTQVGILPLPKHSMTKWKNIKITHGKENCKKETRKSIKNQLSNINGIYLYKTEEIIIYVGKGKPISSRIYSHYRESFEDVPGDTKTKRWRRFFSDQSNIDSLEVYFFELEEEDDRVIFEKILVSYIGKDNVSFEYFI